jgi:amidase
MHEVLRMDAVGQAEAVRNGQVSARELAEAAIARIEAADGELNAVIHRRFERALAEIDAIPADAPFRGVPILLKDLGWREAGEPYSAGSAVRDGLVDAADGYGVVRLREAGFVLLGRTHGAGGVRADAQPVRPGVLGGRIQRRLGGGGGGRDGRAGHRERRRRVDPHPGVPVRPGGAQADARAREPGAGDGRGVERVLVPGVRHQERA